MTRLPSPTAEDIEPDLRPLFAQLMKGRKGPGPGQPLLHHPALSKHVFALSSALREGGALAGQVRELTILATAREVQAPYEWSAHIVAAQAAGVDEAEIAVIASADNTSGLPARERAVIDGVRSLCRKHCLPDEVYDRLATHFNARELVEIVVHAGFYVLLGFVINGFAVDAPDPDRVPFRRAGE